MHLAAGNLWLLQQAGTTPPELEKLPKDPEKSVSAKADVIAWLRTSQEAVQKAYQSADRQKHVQFFGKDAIADGVFLRDPPAQQRAHGPVDRVRADERHRAAMVEVTERGLTYLRACAEHHPKACLPAHHPVVHLGRLLEREDLVH